MRISLPRWRTVAAIAWTLCVSFYTQSVIAADSFPDPVPKVKSYEIAFSPAKESSPPFRYRLMTPISENTPGNAATYYARALIMLKEFPPKTHEQLEKEASLYELPISQISLDDIRSFLKGKEGILHEIELATRCERCDWGIRFQDHRGRDVIEFRMPEFQSIRELARLLRVKSRLEIAEKKYDDAIATLQQLFQISRNLSETPSFICDLIGIAIQSIANDSVMELIAADHSPNLYWALQDLPNPLVDFGPAIEIESTMALRIFPFLKNADTEQHSAEEWYRLVANVITSLNDLEPRSDPNLAPNHLAMLMKAYPIAKRELIASGFDAKRLEEMPTGQVIAIYARDCYIRCGDEYKKWMIVPFVQGFERLSKTSGNMIREGYMSTAPNLPSDRDPLLINTRLIYVAENILRAENRQAIMTAALVTIEAIRMHAAENHGKLPTSLNEITAVPVPNDPSTGRPFLYRVVDGKAELLILPTDLNHTNSGRHFVLTVK